MKTQKTKQNRTVLHCPMTKETAKQAINKMKVNFGKLRKDGSVTVKINGLPKSLLRCFQKIAKADCMNLFFKDVISQAVIN